MHRAPLAKREEQRPSGPAEHRQTSGPNRQCDLSPGSRPQEEEDGGDYAEHGERKKRELSRGLAGRGIPRSRQRKREEKGQERRKEEQDSGGQTSHFLSLRFGPLSSRFSDRPSTGGDLRPIRPPGRPAICRRRGRR